MRFVNSQQRWERSAAIVVRVRELVAELERLPKVPIAAFLNAEMRRKFRRFAARLRAGKVEPRYKNLFTAAQLADICEAAADRDERLEKILKELHDLAEELRVLLAENEAQLADETMAELLPLKDAAQWLGPDSETEQRYREIQQMRRQGQRRRNRPRKPGKPELIPLPGTDYLLHLRHWLSAAETLPDGVPEGERVVYFPEGSRHAGDDPIVLRIGIGEQSWVGSFQRGLTDYTTVQLMPDNRHLLVVAAGAGYIVELITNTLVAEAGRDIVAVVSDEAVPLFLIDHAGTTLEAFGPEGRLWSTGAIANGGFRAFGVDDGVLTFEACQAEGGWVEVGIDLTTASLNATEFRV
jgi:1-acyl-sn-glycerol-3-phosphate acyltransferase